MTVAPREERKDRHVPWKCSPQADGKPAHYNSGKQCPYCEEEIMACKTCKGMEGSLTAVCPGVAVSEEDQQRIYTGLLDYDGEQWIVRKYLTHETPDLGLEFEARDAAGRLNR